jgi:cellulose synthase/poly-beta-1,6-N-acetylglucosamine synthase-like glycosyltransferase
MNLWGAMQTVLVDLQWAILAYFFMVNAWYALLLVCGLFDLRGHLFRIREESHWRLLGSRIAPRISVLAPAHNEETTIVESVRCLLTLYYPNLEVVVINDGSTDATLEILKERFGLTPIYPIYRQRVKTKPVHGLYRSRQYPNLIMVDKENGRKADAMNAGLNLASGELVCAIDVDTVIDPDALQRMVRPFLLGDGVLAAGGTIRLTNGSTVTGGRISKARAPRQLIPGVQAVEYLRAFLFGRLGWNRLGGNLIISGAFGLFQREAVIAVGGYTHDSIGEDMELVLRLRKQGYEQGTSKKVAFIPDPVAWTEAPETAAVLGGQRDRWHRGLSDTLWRHRRVLFNPRYGAMGMIGLPYFLLVEFLAPVVEAVGLTGLGIGLAAGAVNWTFAGLFFLVAYGLGLLLDGMTFAMEEFSFHRYEGLDDRAFLFLWAVLEQFGYRQLTIYWRLRGIVKFLRGQNDWGKMERRGFGPSSTDTPRPVSSTTTEAG